MKPFTGLLMFGIELELVNDDKNFHSENRYNVIEEISDILPEFPCCGEEVPDSWTFKFDGSCDIEITSPILPMDDSGFSRLKEMIATLKLFGYYVNGYCGSHVHVSYADRRNIDSRVILNKLKNKHGEKITWTHRKKYSNYNVGFLYDNYSAIRQVEKNRIEFRIFNGTLNLHAIRNNLRIIEEIMETR